MQELDKHPSIVRWASEEIAIPYRSPIDKKVHKYYPDLWVEKENGERLLIEIKPEDFTRPPILKEGKRRTRRYKRQYVSYRINEAKWDAAKRFCDKHGWTWKIMTDREINGR